MGGAVLGGIGFAVSLMRALTNTSTSLSLVVTPFLWKSSWSTMVIGPPELGGSP